MKKAFFISFLGLGIVLNSCTKDFEEINTNPNAPENVAPQFLLSNILWEAADNNTRQSWLAGNMLAQHTSNVEFQPVDRYDLGSNASYWEGTYRLLNDIELMHNATGSNAAYAALGDILKAYLTSQLTDLWTNVPYFNAIQADEGNFTPTYDSQEEIYTAENGILDLLEKAVPVLENTTSTVQGDIMYDGDFEKWIRFANSLRVRYLLRISGQRDVSSELQALVDNGKLMQSNADNGAIPYLTSAPNQWFIFNEREGRYTDLRMSAQIDSVLENYDDPRVSVLFKSITDSLGNEEFIGLPNGLSRNSQNAFDLSRISLLGSIFRDIPNGVDAQLMLCSELQFALAEAAQKGLISGSFSDYYEKGISAAFSYLNVALPNDYFSRPEITLNGNNDFEKIMTQKWLTLFNNGHEAWFNIRRTGFPVLEIPQDNLNGGQYPVRYRYPESEQAANPENYAEAVGELSEGDTYDSEGWWEQ